ncbi:hsc-70-interacting protein [Leptolyngbya sp. Heron Island J]|uniref:tetratricopeptide repeat protein n=1 Tax=Leptolyngbya sp. Heron Island J TaxID=1385935 RepID=UPI0003B9CFD7|nr:tetratricopeptide repeat protein [Leptolyngbya sp. Heron Island J]ESA34542.1 hsc-70-interacting protein [Leptolyngbya sp. Heron Island J]
MRSILSGVGVMGVLLGLAMPVSAEVLLQAGATETKLVTAETHRSIRHPLTAEVGQTIAIRLKLANNNPRIVSHVAVYIAGKYTPLVVDNQVSYRTVDPSQKSQISHLVVLTLPGEQVGTQMSYEIEPLFDYEVESLFDVEAETVEAVIPSTVRYRMTVETATVAQRLLLEAQAQRTRQEYESAISTYTRAINLNPEIADFYAQRGSAYLAQAETTSDISHIYNAIVADWEMAAQLYEQVGHGYRASALRAQLKQFNN